MSTYVLEGAELEAARKFTAKHNKKHGRDKSVSGGRFAYIFTPTAIGTAVTVECFCGAKKDCTDYDAW